MAIDLDSLARLPQGELTARFRGGRAPRVEDLEGRLEGRHIVSAVVGSIPPLRWVGDILHASVLFPWRGKNFRTVEAGRGEGINRWLPGSLLTAFRFETRVRRSRMGDFDVVELNYDRPTNPLPLRLVRDEVREVESGLWLGTMWLELFGRPLHAGFFALARP